jgi:hypothetical protein
LNSTLFLPLANSPQGAASVPARARLNILRTLHSTGNPIATAIIALALLTGAARGQSAAPEVSIAVAVLEVPGAAPVELAPYQSKAPVTGHPVLGLTADRGQALFNDVIGMKDVKILCHPTTTTRAGQKATVSIGPSVNLSGDNALVFAGVSIDLTPQVSPQVQTRKISLAVSCRQGQVLNQGTTYATSVLNGAGAIRDGQTLVLDGPAAGDTDKHILVFITPRLVDATGKPLYPKPYR